MVDGDQLAEAFGEVVQLDYCHGSQPSCPARLPPGCQSPGAVCLPSDLVAPGARRPAVVSVVITVFRLRPIGHSPGGARIGERARMTVSRPAPCPPGGRPGSGGLGVSFVTPRWIFKVTLKI